MQTGAHGLREHGFAPVGLPPVPAAVTAGFRDHPYRTLRLRMSWTADDDWLFQYVPPSGASGPGGGPVRDLADRRLAAALGSLLRRTLSGPWLDVHADWLIGLHRIRTVARAGATVRVEPPPEPPREDCAFTLVAVLGREGRAPCAPACTARAAAPRCWRPHRTPGRASSWTAGRSPTTTTNCGPDPAAR